jgi:hypothetical protein
MSPQITIPSRLVVVSVAPMIDAVPLMTLKKTKKGQFDSLTRKEKRLRLRRNSNGEGIIQLGLSPWD